MCWFRGAFEALTQAHIQQVGRWQCLGYASCYDVRRGMGHVAEALLEGCVSQLLSQTLTGDWYFKHRSAEDE